jgi:uncharacterized protein
MDVSSKTRVLFDPLYGHIKLTPIEWEIIHSPFYQRLRWIKQLGFSSYVFPGAEHSRFGHSVGVLNNAQKILESIGLAVDFEELTKWRSFSKEALFHQSVRLGALMHDLGTFPFSHTTESAYINFGETENFRDGKALCDDHENLGSFIIKNTDYKRGITRILQKYNIEPQTISDFVKGVSPSILANQILHSDVDCDRMDYLLRDAHYTGLKYGSYDRDYLLYHFRVGVVDKRRILTIGHNAVHCVEDFLLSRFSWYSQVIRSHRGAKFDAVAERICRHFLEEHLIHRYSDLLEMISNDPIKFFGFNDNMFMNLVHKQYLSGGLNKHPQIKNMAECLLLESGAKAIREGDFKQQLINHADTATNDAILKKTVKRMDELAEYVQKHGKKSDWVLSDWPKKDLVFTKHPKSSEETKGRHKLLTRDAVKISYDNGEVKLLSEVEDSIIARLSHVANYIPNLFCSESAFKMLLKDGAIKA